MRRGARPSSPPSSASRPTRPRWPATIKKFAILERDLSQADGELTPTLKVKRPVVLRHFADRAEALYRT